MTAPKKYELDPQPVCELESTYQLSIMSRGHHPAEEFVEEINVEFDDVYGHPWAIEDVKYQWWRLGMWGGDPGAGMAYYEYDAPGRGRFPVTFVEVSRGGWKPEKPEAPKQQRVCGEKCPKLSDLVVNINGRDTRRCGELCGPAPLDAPCPLPLRRQP
uniref:Uncharacterized protein n=1 Tax=viral metagenome TaxID=1070528 RepID=A0A6M3IKQ7_9ZZZZ